MHTHCPECQVELVTNNLGAIYCPDECPPYCQTCGAKETLAPGLDYYCGNVDCPDKQLSSVEKLRKAFAGLPTPVVPMAYPGVATGTVVVNEDTGFVLLGKRKGELGNGMYSLPGGKVDFGEAPFNAAIREVKEETNLDLNPDKTYFTGILTNDYFPERGKQYLCMYYLSVVDSEQQLQVLEPEKVESWDWHDPAALPEPMWANTGKLIAQLYARERFENPDIGEIIQP
jgi:8-oxo-dGTP diphosphatase